MKDDIGPLFHALDALKYDKYIHPVTLSEIKKHQDAQVVKTMSVKLESYNIIKTRAPIDASLKLLSNKIDKNQNDLNDSTILNELVVERVDYLITEDKNIHKKAKILNCSEKVFTIDSFLEKLNAENPKFVDYQVLAVKKVFFGEVDIDDDFFDAFRADYPGFNKWFNRKSNEIAYVCYIDKKIAAFLYLKVEGIIENYGDIFPIFSSAKRLKIGTFKVIYNGYKIGERFLKIVYDNALRLSVEEIYVTIFDNTPEQKRLIDMLMDWGFLPHGIKKTGNGDELVLLRDFRPEVELKNPKLTFPYVSSKASIFILPIYPEYHTELLPDSILKTESKLDFVEHEPYRNAISKVYISRSVNRDLKTGDIIVFYRTGGVYKGVVSTVGVVENLVTSIDNERQFIDLCRKRSIFNDDELVAYWNYNVKNRPFIVNFLAIYSFPKRINLSKLIQLGVIANVNSVPRGFEKISINKFLLILQETESDTKFLVEN